MTRVPFPPPKRQQEGVYTPDNLITGERGLLRAVNTTVRVPANTTYERGTLMGRVLGNQHSARAANAATLTITGALARYSAKVGRYVIRTTTGGAANAQRYALYDPDGQRLAQDIASGAAHAGEAVSFTVTATGAAGVVGDEAYIDVIADRWGRSQVGAADGSQRPAGVLVYQLKNETAVPRDMAAQVYTQGEFSWTEIDDVSGDHGFTFASLEARLAEKGLAIEEVIKLSEQPLV